ncbi:hypothetical protein Tco_1017346 [Tanacetum coccineum]|uniref:Uncharacterized protein n=1 Tax=Tanacetum coccineum TaxID=301880 RepID=A0ABQ5FRA6_9ASTR
MDCMKKFFNVAMFILGTRSPAKDIDGHTCSLCLMKLQELWKRSWTKDAMACLAPSHTVEDAEWLSSKHIYDSTDEEHRITCRRRLCGEKEPHDEWNELVDWFSIRISVELKNEGHARSVRDRVFPVQTDQEILDASVRVTSVRTVGLWAGSYKVVANSRSARQNQAFADVMTREQMTQILRQKEQENELLRKQAEEAQQRAYLAALKADSASNHRASSGRTKILRRWMGVDNARGEDNNESASGEDEEGEQLSVIGNYSSESCGVELVITLRLDL